MADDDFRMQLKDYIPFSQRYARRNHEALNNKEHRDPRVELRSAVVFGTNFIVPTFGTLTLAFNLYSAEIGRGFYQFQRCLESLF